MKPNIPCALCNSNNIKIISNWDRNNNPLQSVIFNTCGLVWIDPRPSDKEINRFYTIDYHKSYKGSKEPKMKHCYRETKRSFDRLSLLAKYMNKNDKILDVGSGAGFIAFILLKMVLILLVLSQIMDMQNFY